MTLSLISRASGTMPRKLPRLSRPLRTTSTLMCHIFEPSRPSPGPPWGARVWLPFPPFQISIKQSCFLNTILYINMIYFFSYYFLLWPLRLPTAVFDIMEDMLTPPDCRRRMGCLPWRVFGFTQHEYKLSPEFTDIYIYIRGLWRIQSIWLDSMNSQPSYDLGCERNSVQTRCLY